MCYVIVVYNKFATPTIPNTNMHGKHTILPRQISFPY